ncbi:hypothetical protein LZ554_002168 [Drepanopeziza brunnea f. sp. 'monogermtubi']|nr:hypothetical protein LZ554_002168 [Drepanopeziza brunnea f. sp. 'monogermtubi']
MLQIMSESGAAQPLDVYATQPVAKFATAEQQQRMLPELISDKSRAGFGVTEPNTGLETTKLRIQATRDGDRYTISGQKI